jgi:hypothetical protein
MDAEDIVDQLVLNIGSSVLPPAGGAAAALFSAMVVDVLVKRNLSAEERSEFETHARSFVDNFGTIIQCGTREQSEGASQALRSALFVGAYYPGSPKALERLKSELDKSRMEKPRAARRKDNVQEVVKRKARELWRRQPSFKGNNGGTANRIHEAVLAEIGTWPITPTGWKPINLNDLDAKKKALWKISKRVARVCGPDQ